MNKSSLLLAVLSAGFLALSCSAKPEGFLRPFVSMNSRVGEQMYEGDYPTRAGFGITAGARIGREHRHEIGVEFSRVRWTDAYTPDYADITFRMEETAMPVVLNYRYRFGRDSQALRAYFGPSVGALRAGWSDRIDDSQGMYSWYHQTSDDWSFTCGGAVGLTYKIAKSFELELGYRFSYVNYSWRDFKMHTLSFGVGKTF